MPKYLGIDFGKKRTGIAETDDIPLIASALETVETKELIPWLTAYLDTHDVAGLVVGQPIQYDGSTAPVEEDILKFIDEVKKRFPDLEIHRIDESFSSRDAVRSMVTAGVGKKKRRTKGNVDKIAATLILREFLEQIGTRTS